MTKRKVTFGVPEVKEFVEEPAEEEEEAVEEVGEGANLPFAKKFKHTLDSDEEDDEEKSEKYNVLDPNDFEGEEEGTARFDDDIKITAFNMKDELEEGHFDKDGAFVYDKKEQITDNWLDNIDWVKLKEVPGEAGTSKESEEPTNQEIDVGQCYASMLLIMKPGESVQRTIRRLGLSAKKIKASKSQASTSNSEEQEKDRALLLELTTLADQILHTGDMDVYEKTFEQLTHTLKEKSSSMDIFAEDDSEVGKGTASADVPEVSWEFKWENKDEAPVFGPNSTEQMLKWVEDGYFESGVWVRQLGKSDTQFYSSKRIDFELYS